ncbi:uncharacterized protein V1510DRAFT_368176 [Dipodascopsis tothii]|uniref:uncharacterized protein n=1 Tax=Dipodascopsis tothii TaxID=44089 RepID=UPI0034CD9926
MSPSKAQYLRSLPSVRARAQLVLAKAKVNALTNFDVDWTGFGAAVDYVVGVIKRDFAGRYAEIPPHGRWQHFNVGGVPRVETLVAEWEGAGADATEVAKRLVDLFLVSVLLDAGAGQTWTYSEPGFARATVGRSEGLALASLYMFTAGQFSAGAPCRVDAAALQKLTEADLVAGTQHSPANALEGLHGRVTLLQGLGAALAAHPEFFATGRPGDVLDYLRGAAVDGAVSVEALWTALMDGLESIWPKDRTSLDGVFLGDAWPLSSLPQDGEPWERIAPFHKLSQWLCYSIIVPLEKYGGVRILHQDLQTGLPEYRNGGLFVDAGALALKPAVAAAGVAAAKAAGLAGTVPLFSPDEDVIVEWRAITLGLLDESLAAVNERLGLAGDDALTLVQMLEAGTWKGGREIAAEKRAGGGPPIAIKSDGTLTAMYKAGAKNSTAVRRLMTEYRQLINESPDGISAGPVDENNFFEWECLIQGPDDTPFEGGVFPATLTFPKDYPLSPPTMKFTCEMFHPNGRSRPGALTAVYKDGTVCISILHPPGDDPNMYESASERWSPIQSIEKILISVMSMLAEPNDESGANIDACKVWRADREQYNRIVRANVRKTLGM